MCERMEENRDICERMEENRQVIRPENYSWAIPLYYYYYNYFYFTILVTKILASRYTVYGFGCSC